jgi:hypothetical protein
MDWSGTPSIFFMEKITSLLVGIPRLLTVDSEWTNYCPESGAAISTTASHFPDLSFFQTVV